MAYTGSYRVGGATFNDQQVGEAFKKALQKSTPGFQGLKAGQFFTGEGGTQYKTVSGIDPNKPGWGQMVDPEYQLIGYQGGAQPTGRARGMGIGEATPGFAILQKMGTPKVEKPTTTTTSGPTIVDPPVEDPKTDDPPVDTGPTMLDLANALGKQVGDLKTAFTDILASQGEQMRALQESQTANMEALTNAMMQAQAMNQQRPQVAGVKMATGAAGTPMQIARRGVTGAFGRRGMRISSLNV